jgi:hypothetical protein
MVLLEGYNRIGPVPGHLYSRSCVRRILNLACLAPSNDAKTENQKACKQLLHEDLQDPNVHRNRWDRPTPLSRRHCTEKRRSGKEIIMPEGLRGPSRSAAEDPNLNNCYPLRYLEIAEAMQEAQIGAIVRTQNRHLPLFCYEEHVVNDLRAVIAYPLQKAALICGNGHPVTGERASPSPSRSSRGTCNPLAPTEEWAELHGGAGLVGERHSPGEVLGEDVDVHEVTSIPPPR